MRSAGFLRKTVGVWGPGVCSLAVSAPREGPMSGPLGNGEGGRGGKRGGRVGEAEFFGYLGMSSGNYLYMCEKYRCS